MLHNDTLLRYLCFIINNKDYGQCGNDSQHLPLVGKEVNSKVILKCLDCDYEQDYIPSLIFKDEWKDWWKYTSASERFSLMRKYDVKQVNDKLIKKMWRGEFLNAL